MAFNYLILAYLRLNYLRFIYAQFWHHFLTTILLLLVPGCIIITDLNKIRSYIYRGVGFHTGPKISYLTTTTTTQKQDCKKTKLLQQVICTYITIQIYTAIHNVSL